NIDDCWELPNREDGHLKADPAAFPEGIKGLADYVHSKGLKLGIYSDWGKATCQNKAGSYGFEATDAKDFADWGVDYLKYDNCNIPSLSEQEKSYQKMRDALAATGRPIVFSICTWEFKDWMPETGNLWRTGGDIHDEWGSMVGTIDNNELRTSYSHPGAWNDPDMLEVGNGGMTDIEYRTHFSLWAVMAAPLIAGNDLRTMSKETADIILNKEVIAVDQDPWGLQGVKVSDDGQGSSVYSKVIQGANSRAVALFNRSNLYASITAKWSDLGIASGPASVRDLWTHQDLGVFNDSYTVAVAGHGTVLLKIVSQAK
ncbi:MAG TPA: glycoside hydrolase family 27 protein, partial [bacterium]|nr:glycoside hydrolase family 27 protein [bacterium]